MLVYHQDFHHIKASIYIIAEVYIFTSIAFDDQQIFLVSNYSTEEVHLFIPAYQIMPFLLWNFLYLKNTMNYHTEILMKLTSLHQTDILYLNNFKPEVHQNEYTFCTITRVSLMMIIQCKHRPQALRGKNIKIILSTSGQFNSSL